MRLLLVVLALATLPGCVVEEGYSGKPGYTGYYGGGYRGGWAPPRAYTPAWRGGWGWRPPALPSRPSGGGGHPPSHQH